MGRLESRMGRCRKCWSSILSFAKGTCDSTRGLLTKRENIQRKGKEQEQEQEQGQKREQCKPVCPRKHKFCTVALLAIMESSGTQFVTISTNSVQQNSTMQEMAVHLRQAYKEKDAPPDVQAFLDKAEKEFSRNNIKSLQAATKSLDHAQKALRDAVQAKKEHRLQWTKHVGDGVKIWETQLESFRVHQAALSEQASKARAEIELSRKILKEVSESSVKEGNLSIPQPIQEETEDANTDNAMDPEEQKLRDQRQGVLNACAGSLGLQATEVQVQEVSDDERESGPHNKRQRSVEPAKTGQGQAKQ